MIADEPDPEANAAMQVVEVIQPSPLTEAAAMELIDIATQATGWSSCHRTSEPA
jgi:hypothetical protein